MFEIIFLGTSASAPSVHRGLSSQMVIHSEHRFLIDAGEGTQRQILKSGLGFKRLEHILVTHGHLDHILGLGGLISTFVRWEVMPKIEIVGGEEALSRINDLIFGVVLRGEYPDVEITLRPIESGIIYEETMFTITAFPVYHRAPGCFGYTFEEKPRRPFLPERAAALDIPPGPWRRDLVLGQCVTLPDGREITPEQVLGPSQPGTKMVHVGDTGRTDNLVEVVRGADVLVIEATYLEPEIEMAERFGHLTARQAAELAVEAEVDQLLLTHVSRRYWEKDIKAEARAIFPHTDVVRDFDHYHIQQGKCVRVAK
ncbi:MAG: ribonuclease Z [Anaerolineaceae bacterium 4572_5.1]|nr:MAG: ribonuclease Z [Anaerolineaceae bacterium 4572_5.1]RLD10311.1 MAG: ribonuclease Z [Chloroflexota bacterium]